MKLSKVFIVVVAMHALLIGSIFCIGGCRTRGLQPIDSAGAGYQVPPPAPIVTTTTTTRRPSPPRIRPEDARPPRTTSRRPSTRPAQGEQAYEIQPGDTAWSISRRYGVTMAELLERNGLTEDSVIKAGSTLILPTGARATAPPPTPRPVVQTPPPTTPTPPTTSAATTAGTEPLPTDGVYAVQPGDSLWTISRKFGTTIDALREANRLTTDLLHPGQELLIPGAATLPKPADSTGAAPAEPPPTIDTAPPAPVEPAPAVGKPETKTYYIEPDETLADVARAHGISLEALMQMNGITDPKEVKSFEPILVPVGGE